MMPVVDQLSIADLSTLLDVRVVDTDAQSYACRTVDAVLCSAEQEKKRKYLAAVEERRAMSRNCGHRCITRRTIVIKKI